jgi:hypothetical protein
MEGRIERALLHLQRFARHLLDSLCDGIAVDGAKSDDAEDEEVESALREVEPVFMPMTSTYTLSPVEGQGMFTGDPAKTVKAEGSSING